MSNQGKFALKLQEMNKNRKMIGWISLKEQHNQFKGNTIKLKKQWKQKNF